MEASQASTTLPDAPVGPGLRVPAFERLAARPGLLVWGALAAALAAIFLVHVPVLDHYFFGDDSVPFADIESKSAWRYISDVFLMRDPTPNWRFLTGIEYLIVYRAFGFNALPFMLVAVLAHTATAGLIFFFVYRTTRAVWTAFLAACFFGLTSASAPTVGQVTAVNNVLAGFFIMLAIITLYEGLDRGPPLGWWLVASVASFAAAIASNESSAVLAPVLALIIAWKATDSPEWWREPQQWLRVAWLSAPYALLGGAALIGFAACGCTEQGKEGVSSLGDHVAGNFWIYLGRLLYPVGMEFPGKPGDAHLVAGLVLLGLVVAMAVRGPALARICAVYLFLALVSYVTITFALAPRYVYAASIPFSILAALLFAEVARYAGRLSPALPVALGVVALGVLGVYSWQTWTQNGDFEARTAEWRDLVANVQERYPEPPPGSAVVVRGGPLTSPLWQFTVLPAYGRVLWGDAGLLTAPDGTTEFCRPYGGLFVLDYDGGRYTSVARDAVAAVDCEAQLQPE
ncbi:MAG: hypothetical protein WEE64_02800 [Dehalococcoidia bacterium]